MNSGLEIDPPEWTPGQAQHLSSPGERPFQERLDQSETLVQRGGRHCSAPRATHSRSLRQHPTFFRPENASSSEPFYLLAGQTLASKGAQAESQPGPGPPLTTKHNAGGRAFKGPIVPPKAPGLNP